MKGRWQHPHRRRDGGPPRTLAVVEPERPRTRVRAEVDGSRPRSRLGRSRWMAPLPLAAAVLVLLAGVGYLSVYRQQSKRTEVVVAVRALAAGSVVRASDLSSAGLAGDKRVLATLVPAGEEGLVVGRTLRSAVAAGAPLSASVVAAPGRGVATLTLAVPALHALAGELRPGDRVSVLATFTDVNGGAQTRVVARNLVVVAVGAASGFDAATQTIPVTVALPGPDLSRASTLALANETGKIDLLREAGAGSSTPIPPASTPAGAP